MKIEIGEKVLCLKAFDNYKIGKFYNFNLIMSIMLWGLEEEEYIITLAKWREQQINNILYGED